MLYLKSNYPVNYNIYIVKLIKINFSFRDCYNFLSELTENLTSTELKDETAVFFNNSLEEIARTIETTNCKDEEDFVNTKKIIANETKMRTYKRKVSIILTVIRNTNVTA